MIRYKIYIEIIQLEEEKKEIEVRIEVQWENEN